MLMDQRVPIDSVSLTKLLNNATIIRIVTIVDITSLSILELFEYEIGMRDIIYSLVNGVITYDNSTPMSATEDNLLSIPANPHHYYAFVRRKVKLTAIGLYILDCIKKERYERRMSQEFRQESSNTNPRHPGTITS
ncbi:MAG TPA: hypothetical protein VH797_06050 [Nitrososphaeraceae archaeon]|jgi:hypothetical protein